MSSLIASRHWYFRALRVLILATLGWAAFKSVSLAQYSDDAQWPNTDFNKRSIELDEIMSGGPPKDGIPAVDEPKFIGIAAAEEWLRDQEPVISLELAGEARAYPLQILIYHEIVNDKIGDRPVSVTFCPLCNASIVFDRRLNGRTLDFGTTGRLRKSDLVMYDRQTESWWQQFTGTAIVGELTGATLVQLPSTIVSFGEFKAAFPNGRVLSRDTGQRRPYGRNPYQGYDRVGQIPFLFSDQVDPRLPAMERVLNVTLSGRNKLYPFSLFKAQPVINDEVADIPVAVFARLGVTSALDARSIADSRVIHSAAAYNRTLDGQTLEFAQSGEAIVDTNSESTWNLFGQAISGPMRGKRLQPVPGGVHFAFAWLAFNPESDIYKAP